MLVIGSSMRALKDIDFDSRHVFSRVGTVTKPIAIFNMPICLVRYLPVAPVDRDIFLDR